MENNKKKDEPKKGSPLLDRYIQRNAMDKMKQIDERVLADAIKSMLIEGKEDPKNLN
jgi:hypothetical protein